MVTFSISTFFFDFVFSGECCRKFHWKSFVRTIVTNSYFDTGRQKCNNSPDLIYYTAVHQYLGPYPLWSLTVKFPENTWQICELIKLSYRTELKDMIHKLFKKVVNNDVKHFLIQYPTLCQSRDILLEQIVNFSSVEK